MSPRHSHVADRLGRRAEYSVYWLGGVGCGGALRRRKLNYAKAGLGCIIAAMYITSLATQVRVTDLDRALRFYTETLGFVEQFRIRDIYAIVRAGGTSLHLKQVDAVDPSIEFVKDGNHLHLYIRVIDIEETFRELSGKVEIVYPIAAKPWGSREFTIRDPDGHTIYLAEADSESANPTGM